MNHRTRIKICGITRAEDLRSAVHAGVDAVGFVFFPPSPRYVGTDAARQLAFEVPPFVARVGLFVNAEPKVVREIMAAVPLEVLQFHGDEDEGYCRQFDKPYVKVARVRPELDLLEYAGLFPSAQGLLLDAHVEGYGGAGQSFDWGLIPSSLPLPVVLSGGLTSANVQQAVAKIRPFAVDVSSGVEAAKGIKDAARILAFIAAVKAADLNADAK